jgi:D-alanyl-lipoteichoic acid acyltransferase DltB (MBOAT superfamily)
VPLVSPLFLAFLLVSLLVFYSLPGRWQPAWLLAASYLFCASQGWKVLALLILLTLANFVLSRPVCLSPARARWTLLAALAVNLGPLLFFKSAQLLLSEQAAAGSFMGVSGSAAWWALPIGLSFYALQAVSFQIDLRRGQVSPPGFVGLAIYLGYFPKLLAGPLERAGCFLPQLTADRDLDAKRRAVAVSLIVVGLVRKLLIGDPLMATIPPAVFTSPAEASGLLVWLFVYTVALYQDFAGYTSIARGVSSLFGIDLSPNFDSPFFARSFTEFWNRWHMSLSQWLRDYVFVPVSRALLRRGYAFEGAVNLVVPAMATMLASGLWHGTGWHMLVWGGLHGAYLAAEKARRARRPAPTPDRWRLVWRVAGAVAVVGVVTLTNVFFRLSVGKALGFLTAALTPAAPAWPDPRVAALLALGLGIDWLQWRSREELFFLRWRPAARRAALAAALLALFTTGRLEGATSFVYERF